MKNTPLALILIARKKGENPYVVKNKMSHFQDENTEKRIRADSERCLYFLSWSILLIFVVIAVCMTYLATYGTGSRSLAWSGGDIAAQRARIVDRQGRTLATNFETHSLYAEPDRMINPAAVAAKLADLFPELEYDRLLKDFTGKRKFIWIKRKISPKQQQAVHDLGEPGLFLGPREMRIYPKGHLAAHVLGGATFGKEGVSAAEVIGVAGIERKLDDILRDTTSTEQPLVLSIDVTIQDIIEDVLHGGMELFDARGASAVLMNVHTGELLSLASLPDFDPNERPGFPTSGNPADSPLFNRAAQGVYELGSVFKIFTAAQSIDLGLVTEDTIINTSERIRVGPFSIREFRNRDYGNLSVSDIIVKSSNRGIARLGLMIGKERQRDFIDKLGMLKPLELEIIEAKKSQPLFPKNWGKTSIITISYGHGISITPVHLAAAYAAIANGGMYVTPTLLKQNNAHKSYRVMSSESAKVALKMLRRVVTDGTATFARESAYPIAGKTGTAGKPKATGGYYDDKVISTFAAIFPDDNPQYVLVVTFYEPVGLSDDKPRRTAGWTAVPAAVEVIGRIAPLLNLALKLQ